MAEEQLRNIEYVILKNEPSPRSYGQYIFDLFNTANQFPGRNLSESAEDLYTRQEDIHEPSLYKLRRDIGDPIYSRNIYLSNVMFYMDSHKYSNFKTELRYFDSECPYSTDFFNSSGGGTHDIWGTMIGECGENGGPYRQQLVDYESDSNKDRSGRFILTDMLGGGYYAYGPGSDIATAETCDPDTFECEPTYDVTASSTDYYISKKNINNCGNSACRRKPPSQHNYVANQSTNFSYGGVDINGVMFITLNPGYPSSEGGDDLGYPYTVFNMFSEVYHKDIPSEQLHGQSWHICTYGSGDNWSWGWYSGHWYPEWSTVGRGKRIECFEIPKSDFIDQWFEVKDYSFERANTSDTYNVKHYQRNFNALKHSTWENDVHLWNLGGYHIAIGLLPPKLSDINPFSRDSNFLDPSSGRNEFQGWIDPDGYNVEGGGFRFYNPYVMDGMNTPYSMLDLTGVYKPDGSHFTLSESRDLDFRMFIQTDVNDLEVQREYDMDTSEYSLVAAPATVTISTDIGSNNKSYYLSDEFKVNSKTYTFAELQEEYNINVKYFVADWGDAESFENIEDLFPTNLGELNQKINQNTFKVVEHTGELSHKYYKSGPQTITLFAMLVFSRETNGQIEEMVLKTKKIETTILLTKEEIFYPDYLNLGKGDFPLIPWFEVAPIISGFSRESDYVDSLRVLSNSADTLFDEYDEKFIKGYTKQAYKNDELGDYVGKSDISQVRYFSKPYDLYSLLGGFTWNNYLNHVFSNENMNPDQCILGVIGEGVASTYNTGVGGWFGSIDYIDFDTPYSLTTNSPSCIFSHPLLDVDGQSIEFSSTQPAEGIKFVFPLGSSGPSNDSFIDYSNFYELYYNELFVNESSVSEIFINDLKDPKFKKDCIIEYNFYDNDGIVVRDSSGNENSGILIGDFGITKINQDIPIGVNSTIKKPNIDENEDGVF